MSSARSVLLLASLALPPPAVAGTLHGVWCGPELTLHLDPLGVGANEHTTCDATPPPAETGTYYNASLDCRNVYPGEKRADGTFEMIEVPLDTPKSIIAVRVTGDRLAVLFDADDEGRLLDRCD